MPQIKSSVTSTRGQCDMLGFSLCIQFASAIGQFSFRFPLVSVGFWVSGNMET
jgi:hypothetical protein